MENDNAKIADRDSWENLTFLSDKKTQISLDRKFTKAEFEKISRGLFPLDMDDKWFVFLENNILYFHRSWTGQCIYQAQFKVENNLYKASEVWVNRDASQYKETNNKYDEKLLLFLIENLLLGNNTPFPIRTNDSKDYPKGAIQHNIAGTGYREIEIED